MFCSQHTIQKPAGQGTEMAKAEARFCAQLTIFALIWTYALDEKHEEKMGSVISVTVSGVLVPGLVWVSQKLDS